MTRPSSRLTLVAALAANLGIAIAKLVAAVWTGSAVMLSEAIHSLVDTCNELLLLLGVHLSRKPADAEHPYGHGKELYFWSLIVAVLIFGAGGAVAVYDGVQRLLHPQPSGHRVWNYAVLGVAALFEGSSFTIALREFRKAHRGEGILHGIHASKNPAEFAVLLEDSAALVGLAIAFAGVYLSARLAAPRLEGVASVLIGLVLGGVAVLLMYETRGLLVGESADPRTVLQIRAIVERDPAVVRLERVLTMQLGSDAVLVNLGIQFQPQLSSGEAASAIDRIERAIRLAVADARYVSIEAESLRRCAPDASRLRATAAPGMSRASSASSSPPSSTTQPNR